jgi:hypothetical protein
MNGSMAVNLARMGADMKTFSLLLLFLCLLSTYSQNEDSLTLFSVGRIVIEDKRILLNGVTSNNNQPLELIYFDGQQWNKIPEDTLPFRFTSNSRFTPSKFSQSIFMTSYQYLWEYDGNKWIPHSIKDSLDGIRHYDEIIELPDSSLVLFSTHYVKTFDSTSSDSVIVNYKELQKFKDGKFTTIESIILSQYSSMNNLKKHVNGTYSYQLVFAKAVKRQGVDILTFSADGQLLRRDKYPDLTPFGYNQVGGYVNFQDYLLDSKGSFWHLVYTPALYDAPKHARMVEVTLDGEILLYNEDFGLPSPWNPMPNKFEIDENDNIWFNYYYNLERSIFKLHADRKTLTEFKYVDILKNSISYIGGYTGEPFEALGPFSLIKYLQEEKSILLFIYPYPLIKFFPDKILATVKEQTNNPIQLYPNPVQYGNTITIESSLFEKTNSPLSVVIRDIRGATIREELISKFGNLLSINTVGLNRGSYYVSVLNNNKIILQTNFVKE